MEEDTQKRIDDANALLDKAGYNDLVAVRKIDGVDDDMSRGYDGKYLRAIVGIKDEQLYASELSIHEHRERVRQLEQDVVNRDRQIDRLVTLIENYSKGIERLEKLVIEVKKDNASGAQAQVSMLDALDKQTGVLTKHLNGLVEDIKTFFSILNKEEIKRNKTIEELIGGLAPNATVDEINSKLELFRSDILLPMQQTINATYNAEGKSSARTQDSFIALIDLIKGRAATIRNDISYSRDTLKQEIGSIRPSRF